MGLKLANKEYVDNLNSKKLALAREHLASQVVLTEAQTEVVFATLLARGHLLLEGPPGMGKTTLAKSLADLWQAQASRIQMTSDLLPSDIVGYLRYHPGKLEFETRMGPIFANVVLADELNRGNSRTQTALLEAMAEGQVTIDGKGHALPQPFFVIATQNPHDSAGVFDLSESQLDRFSASLWLDLLPAEDEREVYRRHLSGATLPASPGLTLQDLRSLQDETATVRIGEELVLALQGFFKSLRESSELAGALSIRAGLQVLGLAKGLARVRGRDFVTARELRDLMPSAFAHRLQFADGRRRNLKDRWAWISERSESHDFPS